MSTDFKESIQKISSQAQEPAWSKSLREESLSQFESLPTPDKNTEEWRRTDLNKILFSNLDIQTKNQTFETLNKDFNSTPYINPENYDSKSLIVGTVPSGVLFCSLSEALVKHADLLKPYLEKTKSRNLKKFVALSNALWNGGMFLYVPKNTSVPMPLYSRVGPSQEKNSGSESQHSFISKIVVILEENSNATLVSDEVTDPDWSGWMDTLTEIHLGVGAHLTFIRAQRASLKSTSLSNFYSDGEKDSSLNLMNLSVGSALQKSDWNIDLLGQGSEARLFGLVKGVNNQNFDHTLLLKHLVPRTSSNVLFKTALTDQARSLFTGLIHVTKAAQKTQAYQTNRNLLLSKKARADTIPKLEIEADDVQCGHGAVVSSIEPDQLYYLMTRGLTKEEAQALIIEGFYEDVLAQWLDGLKGSEKNKELISEILLDWIHKIIFTSDYKEKVLQS